jgi:hypothetical protein
MNEIQPVTPISVDNIKSKIHEIRGQKVMLDRDLAELYQVETKVLNQAVKRNIKGFPEDTMFVLTKDEFDSLRSQFVTSNKKFYCFRLLNKHFFWFFLDNSYRLCSLI